MRAKFLFPLILLLNLQPIVAQEMQQEIVTGMFSIAGGVSVGAPDVTSAQFTQELESIWKGHPGGYEAINLVHVYSKPINNPLTNYNFSFWSTLFAKAKAISPNFKIQMSATIAELDTNKDQILNQTEKSNFLIGLDLILNDPNSDVIGGWIIADEPSNGNHLVSDIAWLYDTIKAISDKPIYIVEQARTGIADYATYNCDILMLDHYQYPNIFSESIQSLTSFVIKARSDLDAAGREHVPIHVVLVGGEEVAPENTLNSSEIASHGITHSVIRKMLDIGVEGIWFYAWRVAGIFDDDVVYRWVQSEDYAEAIETEPYDVDYLVTGFSTPSKTDNAIYLSDIGQGQSPGSGSVYNSTYYHAAFLNSGDLMGEEGNDTDHFISQNLKSNGDGDDELFTVFSNASGNDVVTYIDSDGTNPDSNPVANLGSYKITASTIGDFDGDGDDEIVVGLKIGHNLAIGISNDGVSFDNILYQYTSLTDFISNLTSGDFNADGRDELIMVTQNALYTETKIYRSDIGLGQAAQHSLIYSSDYYHVTTLTAGNFKNESRDYLVTGFSSSSLNDNRVYISNIGAGQSPGAGVSFFSGTYHSTASTAGDFDRSGYEDLVIAFTNSSKTNSFISRIDYLDTNNDDPFLSSNRIYTSTYYHIPSITAGSFRESLPSGTSKVAARSITETDESLPGELYLAQNYPNPFNPTTQITYQVPKQSLVSLEVYNMLGQKVATLVNQDQAPGEYTVNFNGRNLASGVYLYILKSGNTQIQKKMLLIK